jgi:hypothetical protein
VVKQSPRVDARADRQAFLLGRAARDVIASFARDASTEAIDTCLNAWVDEVGPASPSEGPIAKPDVASLRGFLAQCLGVSGEGDARSRGRAADASSDIPVVKNTDKGSSR